MVEIDWAKEADLPQILGLANHAAEVGVANFATEPEPLADWQASFAATRVTHPWLVAREREAGAVVAFAKAGAHRARGAYRFSVELSVYVDPAFHGRGVGTALYAALLPLLRAQGYVTLLAGITSGQSVSERLHARFGFRPCGTLHRVGWKRDAWHDVGYWELHLRPPAAPPAPLRPVAEVPLVRREPLGAAPSRALIAALDEELLRRYPEPGATHFRLDEEEVGRGRGAFLVAWLDGERVGCGALRRVDAERAELKRMFVSPAHRGRRIGAALLDALELEARLLGVRELLLEAGERQPEALALYRRAGFLPIPAFGDYVDSPLSLCLGKPIA